MQNPAERDTASENTRGGGQDGPVTLENEFLRIVAAIDQDTVKALEYVQREIVPQAKWFDYETYLSCSPKPYDFYDPITRHRRATRQLCHWAT